MSLVNEHDFINTIKQVAIEAVKSTRPQETLFATITSLNPLEMKVENGQIVDEDYLVPTQAAKNGLEQGEKVAVLRIQGGQRFLILDKVVKP